MRKAEEGCAELEWLLPGLLFAVLLELRFAVLFILPGGWR